MARISKRLREEMVEVAKEDLDKCLQLVYNAGYRLGLRKTQNQPPTGVAEEVE
jgi:hypothetical protein